MPTVEDYFDDDTDLPIPSGSQSRALPNTGERGALLQEIGDDDDELDFNKLSEQGRGIFGEDATAPPPSNDKGKMTVREDPGDLRPSGPAGGVPGMPGMNPNTPMGGFMGDMMKLQQADEERLEKLRRQFGSAQIKDPGVYKEWNSIYPIYFDAKVSKSDGRRVAASDAVWWPQAVYIAEACRSLGLPCVLEPDRCHPADWENPGRVKVQFESEGRYMNPIVKNRTQLYRHISAQIRQAHPTLVYSKPAKRTPAESSTKMGQKSKSDKSKSSKPVQSRRLPSRPAPPPQPLPSLDDRFPLHSPLVSAGVAVAAIKRDMESEKENKKKGIGGGDEPAKEKQPKMKRVVVRGKR